MPIKSPFVVECALPLLPQNYKLGNRMPRCVAYKMLIHGCKAHLLRVGRHLHISSAICVAPLPLMLTNFLPLVLANKFNRRASLISGEDVDSHRWHHSQDLTRTGADGNEHQFNRLAVADRPEVVWAAHSARREARVASIPCGRLTPSSARPRRQQNTP